MHEDEDVARLFDVVPAAHAGRLLCAEFPVGSAELSKQGRQVLNDVVRIVQKHGNSTAAVVAYANDASSVKANMALSEQRARTVANYIRQQGVGDPGILHK